MCWVHHIQLFRSIVFWLQACPDPESLSVRTALCRMGERVNPNPDSDSAPPSGTRGLTRFIYVYVYTYIYIHIHIHLYVCIHLVNYNKLWLRFPLMTPGMPRHKSYSVPTAMFQMDEIYICVYTYYMYIYMYIHVHIF